MLSTRASLSTARRWALLVAILFAGMGARGAEVSAEQIVLAAQAQQIFAANCSSCHFPATTKKTKFTYVLDAVLLIQKNKIVPGQPSLSPLYKRLADPIDSMPPAEETARPSKDDIAIVRRWIEAGAPAFNPPQASAVHESAPTLAPNVVPPDTRPAAEIVAATETNPSKQPTRPEQPAPAKPPAATALEPNADAVLPQDLSIDIGGGVRLQLVCIPAGRFTRGSPNNEPGREVDEAPQETVRVAQPFMMATYEISQDQYQAVMGHNPSSVKGGHLPVDNVSWEDARKFCETLSAKTAWKVALPTELQWEYACRAGSETRFYLGATEADLNAAGWSKANSGKQIHECGKLKPNAFGLYDMLGNVEEWCQDEFTAYGTMPVSADHKRAIRGGNFESAAKYCRSAYRYKADPSEHETGRGFRVIAMPK